MLIVRMIYFKINQQTLYNICNKVMYIKIWYINNYDHIFNKYLTENNSIFNIF